MSATNRNILTAGTVITMSETRARRTRRDDYRNGDPAPKPVSVSRLRRQREADDAVRDAEEIYGLRITG